MGAWNKPLPHPTETSRPYWDGLKAHQVRLQRCEACGRWIFFPRAHCPACASRSLAWHEVTGEGTLYTFTVARIPTLPEFADEGPQVLAVVELDEGPHLNTTIVGVAPAALRVGERVRPVFDDRPGEITLLRYTPVGSSHPGVLTSEPTKGEGEPKPVAETAAPAKRKVSCKDLGSMKALVSEEWSGWSNEFLVSQEIIDQFAALSGDDYWIHTDPERAKAQSPFGTTIAHGMLVLSLASRLKLPLDYEIVDFGNIVNYGSDRLRFAAPVPSGRRIHARGRVKAVDSVKSGVQVTMEIAIHVVGSERPSVLNELVMLYM
ncbi:MAG TPA: OB-fold domain-containing protein [Steroidobacteraceae bacterium]|nr:OB-fold domain-containing protein [Steroidobacteraceae bacterium]